MTLSLNPQASNALQCWLYDLFYRHIHQGKTPNASSIKDKAAKAKKPSLIAGVQNKIIESHITAHITNGSWRIPPSPINDKVAGCFPQWKTWHPKKTTPPLKTPAISTFSETSSTTQYSLSSLRSDMASPVKSDPDHRPASSTIRHSFSKTSQTMGSIQATNLQNHKLKVHTFRDTGYSKRLIPEALDHSNTVSHWDDRLKHLNAISSQTNNGSALERQDTNLLRHARLLFKHNHSNGSEQDFDLITKAPLMMSECIELCQRQVPQIAILGKITSTHQTGLNEDDSESNYLLLNVNIPWTAFICGLQGAGKSHSLSILLENCLIPNKIINTVTRPLSALVLSYSPYSSVGVGKPCEAAYLAIPDPLTPNLLKNATIHSVREVNVLVSRSNYANMAKTYSRIPGVRVNPLLLKPSQLTITAMLKLMSVSSENNALYIQVVNRILRDMAAEASENFDYENFKQRLAMEPLTPLQKVPLQIRLEILESFIGSESNPNQLDPISGNITILDLTCPFLDAETACVLFSICLDIFAGAPSTTGRVVALDEAHKFMSNQTASQDFAKSIIRNIRLQRHLGIRTIISTQDPIVHPELLELANFIVMHRFDSPRWFETLERHVGFSDTIKSSSSETEFYRLQSPTVFETIMCLRTGEALLYCPQLAIPSGEVIQKVIKHLGNTLMKVGIRGRLTMDGGLTKTAL